MQTGVVFNIQKYSIHDGPGIRTTVFLKGCTLRCWWCHNPESQLGTPELSLIDNHCLQCGRCVEVCPFGEPSGDAVLPHVDRQRCIRCGQCVAVCSAGAREMVGQTMTVDEVMKEILKDRIFYDDSGGGATISGGEPLVQPAFCRELLAACRAEDIHTSVDTCGAVSRDELLSLAPLTDLFLYDIKVMDQRRHEEHTGASNEKILANLRELDRVHDNIWIRVPIVPGLNDTVREIQEIARLASTLRGVRQINLLPYHSMGAGKTQRLGGQDASVSLRVPSGEAMETLVAAAREVGVNAKIGG
jgi:pyruvate formate lyase activating enzyme